MANMDWALEIAAAHPALEGAMVTSNGPWIEVLLANGRTFRFRPFEMIKESAPEETKKIMLEKLITIGVQGAQEAEYSEPKVSVDVTPVQAVENSMDEQAEAGAGEILIPMVRAADYWVHVNNGLEDSLVYLPLTDFIGVGIGHLEGNAVRPVYYHELGLNPGEAELGPIFDNAIHNFHSYNNRLSGPHVELGLYEGRGAEVFIIEGPPHHQATWFADIDMLRNMAGALAEEYPDSIFLFFPATPYAMLAIRDDDPGLVQALREINRYPRADLLYPLPHTIAADGWMEWIPLPDHPAYKLLSEMRTRSRRRIYREQEKFMNRGPLDNGVLASYDVHKLSAGNIATATWRKSYSHGSIPKVDMVRFLDDENPESPQSVTLNLQVAQEIWPEGIVEQKGVWPPRYAITRFPDDATIRVLKEHSATGM